MCSGCYNDFDKHNIINEDDIIYCFNCFNKLYTQEEVWNVSDENNDDEDDDEDDDDDENNNMSD